MNSIKSCLINHSVSQTIWRSISIRDWPIKYSISSNTNPKKLKEKLDA